MPPRDRGIDGKRYEYHTLACEREIDREGKKRRVGKRTHEHENLSLHERIEEGGEFKGDRGGGKQAGVWGMMRCCRR